MEEGNPNPPGAGMPATGPDDLEQVRELLLGREKIRIARLEERLDCLETRAREVGRVLPQAVDLCSSEGDRLARSLAPAVESGLHESVRRRPTVLTNAIFPIIGPAIRRASAEAVGRLVQTINHAVEYSLSLRGLSWRVEALRTGRSYAELLLYHTLVYRVEQLFLIQRPTGLLLHHVAASAVPAQDGDVVSGMLTAIQDFVVDSFRVGPGESLQMFQVGGLSVWVETGPHASLAAVIRGNAPLNLRQMLQETLERIHREFGDTLRATRGDTEALAGVAPILAECLLAQHGQSAFRPSRRTWLLVGVAVGLAAIWAFTVMRENRRWAAYLERLGTEEGILVVSTGKQKGRYLLTGWRDPLAADPAALLQQFDLGSDEVTGRWETYQSISPPLVLRRAHRLLRPPAGVTLRFEDGVLRAEGVAPPAWAEGARHRALAIPGVEEFESMPLSEDSHALLTASLRKVEEAVLLFGETTRLVLGQEPVVARLVADLNSFNQVAQRAGRRFRISVLGHTDRTGTPEYNLKLSSQRSEEVRGLLQSRGIPAAWLVGTGCGATRPVRPDLGPGEEPLNRRVTFQVLLGPVVTAPPLP